jgi:hypothetical protein
MSTSYASRPAITRTIPAVGRSGAFAGRPSAAALQLPRASSWPGASPASGIGLGRLPCTSDATQDDARPNGGRRSGRGRASSAHRARSIARRRGERSRRRPMGELTTGYDRSQRHPGWRSSSCLDASGLLCWAAARRPERTEGPRGGAYTASPVAPPTQRAKRPTSGHGRAHPGRSLPPRGQDDRGGPPGAAGRPPAGSPLVRSPAQRGSRASTLAHASTDVWMLPRAEWSGRGRGSHV